MKKLISFAACCILAAAFSGTAMAQLQIGTTNPIVRVDDRELIFEDQKPVINTASNRTLVPVRGVFEAMGSKVNWDQEKSKVTIISVDNLTRVELYINNSVMTVYEMTSLFTSEKSEVVLDAAPVIYNNRTMMPLRAVCEAMHAEVKWDENQEINVFSKRYNKFMAEKIDEFGPDYKLSDTTLNMYLTTDAKDVKKGDTIDVYVNVKNIEPYKDTFLCGGMVTMEYDDKNFKYESAALLQEGKPREDVEVTDNPTFEGNSVRVLFIVIGNQEDRGPKAVEGAVYKLTFTALSDNGGEFALTDRVNTERAEDCCVIYDDIKELLMPETYKELYIDRTPVAVK